MLVFLILVACVAFVYWALSKNVKEERDTPSSVVFKSPVDNKRRFEDLIDFVKKGAVPSFPLDQENLNPDFLNQFDFLSIDFETFTRDPLSAVSLGIIGVQSGKVVLVKEYFFNNPVSSDNEYFHVNKIYSEDVIDQPFFSEYWEEIRGIIDDELVVIHNASFDLNVLSSLIDHFGLTKTKFSYVCTMVESRKVFPDSVSYSLESLTEENLLPYWHHNAVFDAFSTALLYLEIAKEIRSRSELSSLLNGKVFPYKKKKEPKEPTVREDYSKVVYVQKDIKNLELDFYRGKSVVVTGDFLLLDRDWIENHVEENKGIIRSSVSGKTFLLIYGSQPGPTKMSKIIAINRERQIQGEEPSIVVSENEFIDFLIVHGIVLRDT